MLSNLALGNDTILRGNSRHFGEKAKPSGLVEHPAIDQHYQNLLRPISGRPSPNRSAAPWSRTSRSPSASA